GRAEVGDTVAIQVSDCDTSARRILHGVLQRAVPISEQHPHGVALTSGNHIKFAIAVEVGKSDAIPLKVRNWIRNRVAEGSVSPPEKNPDISVVVGGDQVGHPISVQITGGNRLWHGADPVAGTRAERPVPPTTAHP